MPDESAPTLDIPPVRKKIPFLLIGFVIVLFAVVAIISLFLIGYFSTTKEESQIYNMDFNGIASGDGGIYVKEELYDVSSVPGSFVSERIFNGTEGTFSKFSVGGTGDFGMLSIDANTQDRTSGLSSLVVSDAIPQMDYGMINYSSTFSLDFNLSYYRSLSGPQFSHPINYQAIIEATNGWYVFDDRAILCFDEASGTEKVQYNFFDTSGTNPIYDTGCTISMDDPSSIITHCMYPQRCTEVNTLDYASKKYTVSFYDGSGNPFFTRTLTMGNLPSYPLSGSLRYDIANQNLCNSPACSSLRTYIYGASIEAR